MKSFYYFAIIFLTISIVFGSHDDMDRLIIENAENYASTIIGRVERNREECPSLPERSAAEEQLKKCLVETIEGAIQTYNKNKTGSTRRNEFCKMLPNFLECSSSLINEMVSCGKNPELVTIIGLFKGECEYENQTGLKGLEDEFGGSCFKGTPAYPELTQCLKETVLTVSSEEQDSSFDSFWNKFCPFLTVLKKCSTPVLEKHCPELFGKLSSLYESSKSLSPDPSGFETCFDSSKFAPLNRSS